MQNIPKNRIGFSTVLMWILFLSLTRIEIENNSAEYRYSGTLNNSKLWKGYKKNIKDQRTMLMLDSF